MTRFEQVVTPGIIWSHLHSHIPLSRQAKIASSVKFFRLEELYGELPVWKAVPEVERREIYVDVQHNLAKKEKEDAKALTKRNKKRLGEILDQVHNPN